MSRLPGGMSGEQLLDQAFAFNWDGSNIETGQEIEANVMAFVIQQILSTIPVDLTYQDGSVKPRLLTDVTGERQSPELVADMSAGMLQYLIETLDRMGGVEGIMDFYRQDPNTATQEIMNEITRNTIHPTTGQPVLLGDEPTPANMEAIALFEIGSGGQSLARLSQLAVQMYSDPNADRQQIENGMFRIFENQMQSGRMNITDPMGQFPTQSLVGADNLEQYFDEDRLNAVTTNTLGQQPTNPGETKEDRREPRGGGERKETDRGGGERKEDNTVAGITNNLDNMTLRTPPSTAGQGRQYPTREPPKPPEE
jgi:hypothetical protein